MNTGFKIFSKMLLRLLSFGVLSVYQLFYVYCKGKIQPFLICSFYFCLVKGGSALKVAKQFGIRGLVAYINYLFNKKLSVIIYY